MSRTNYRKIVDEVTKTFGAIQSVISGPHECVGHDAVCVTVKNLDPTQTLSVWIDKGPTATNFDDSSDGAGGPVLIVPPLKTRSYTHNRKMSGLGAYVQFRGVADGAGNASAVVSVNYESAP